MCCKRLHSGATLGSWSSQQVLPVTRVAQLENTYTLNGFTLRSKWVVWSSLSNTWSKCEILEITEEGAKVLDLSNGIEEVVNPEMSRMVYPNWIRVHLRKKAWR